MTVNVSRFNFKDPAAVAVEVLGFPATPTTLAAIEQGVKDREARPSALAALVLGSPDFQRR